MRYFGFVLLLPSERGRGRGLCRTTFGCVIKWRSIFSSPISLRKGGKGEGGAATSAAANSERVGPVEDKTAGVAAGVGPDAERIVSPPARERDEADDEPAPKRRRSSRTATNED